MAAIRELAEDVSALRQMREVGMDKAAILRMAEDAIASPHISRNPRSVTTDDLIDLYAKAY